MNKKPDRQTAMLHIIKLVRDDFPFYDPESQICGDTCVGCPKKLLELVDSEIEEWEHKIASGETPNFAEIDSFAKLCRNIRRSLKRSGVIDNKLVNL
jgi:hypothetical protein